jgi:hypothetical protein
MKKYCILLTVTVCLLIAAIAVPEVIIASMPTAETAKVQRIEHIDYVDAEGDIFKDGRESAFVKVYVSEKDISKVKEGLKAEITGDAFPDKTYSGIVDEIAATATKQNAGAFQKTVVAVNIKLTDADELIKAGYTADVRILTSEPNELDIVPYEAVNQDDSGEEFVYVFNSGVAVRKDIETGRELSDGVEVVSGISKNDTLLKTDDKIKEGQPVIIEE